ncbi:putative photosynthetic complex assembly protein PuhE [Limibaculum sp. FT325]|uniref:putative photosynthetic complex assembly protein PuhE n=1 Tax=Thermohalobaculum sediminis TaxID=2939436 RepID=UPI0020C05D2A|nr:putative photosynthetic complex assembly protein PuhE [Limibaculum sediminis]MCL5778600.1 putative photosynthetic complex assembly protein PuhE [Limibaculum sediminis]
MPVTQLWLPVLFALFVWWFSTGAIFWLARRGEAARSMTVTGATVLLALALACAKGIRDDTAIWAAFVSFACGVMAWAWIEIAFLFGAVTGPRKQPCPPDAGPWGRFAYAVAAILWHELAILGLGTLMVLLSWGHPNQVGAWTFVLLMGMRLSAKLNLFLGVPYPPRELLPADLAHLGSFFRTAPLNPLLPVVITAATVLLALVGWRASEPGLDPFHAAAYALFGTMLALGIVEHWLLVLPVQETALWKWFLEGGGRGKASPAATGMVDIDAQTAYVTSKTGHRSGGARTLAGGMPAPIQGG